MMYERLRSAICVVAIVISVVLVPSVIRANEYPEIKDSNFTVTTQNVDIVEYIASVSKSFSKSFLVDSHVNGRISISTAEPLSANEYYRWGI